MATTKSKEIKAVKAQRQIDLWSEIQGMQHRRPQSGCPLCPVWGVALDVNDRSTYGRQHEEAALLFEAWGEEGNWANNVSQVAAELGISCTEEEARDHFNYHRPEQPIPRRRLNRNGAILEANLLPERARQILFQVYKQRLLSHTQIVELFFYGQPQKSAQVSANRLLRSLVKGHFLYRFYPPKEWVKSRSRKTSISWGMSVLDKGEEGDFSRAITKEVFYLLGRNGIPYIEEKLQSHVWPDACISMARAVRQKPLLHDWRANHCFVLLQRALKARGGVLQLPRGELTQGKMLLENWYGSRLTEMRIWSRRLRREIEMRPDGFATLSLERSGFDKNSLPSTQLPFFYEYDNATKPASAVADQMLAYHQLALSPELGRRFPELRVSEYAAPMIMIFRGEEERLEAIRRSFIKRARRAGFNTGVPIFMVLESDWIGDPFTKECVKLAWDEHDEGHNLLSVLLHASEKLIESRTLTDRQVLTIDPRPTPKRASTREMESRARADKKTKERQKAEGIAIGKKNMKVDKKQSGTSSKRKQEGIYGELNDEEDDGFNDEFSPLRYKEREEFSDGLSDEYPYEYIEKEEDSERPKRELGLLEEEEMILSEDSPIELTRNTKSSHRGPHGLDAEQATVDIQAFFDYEGGGKSNRLEDPLTTLSAPSNITKEDYEEKEKPNQETKPPLSSIKEDKKSNEAPALSPKSKRQEQGQKGRVEESNSVGAESEKTVKPRLERTKEEKLQKDKIQPKGIVKDGLPAKERTESLAARRRRIQQLELQTEEEPLFDPEEALTILREGPHKIRVVQGTPPKEVGDKSIKPPTDKKPSTRDPKEKPSSFSVRDLLDQANKKKKP